MSVQAYELYLPEYCPDNKYYFAKDVAFIEPTTVSIQNSTLWAIVDSLDRLTAPMTVVLTKTNGYSSELYRTVCNYPFTFPIPTIFEITSIDAKTTFYIPGDRFLQFDATSPCVQVLNNQWQPNEFRYHTLAAFYRLGIIPTISQSVFSEQQQFSKISETFFEKFNLHPPLAMALQAIFKNLYFAFHFFGFDFPTTAAEKQSLQAVQALAQVVTSSNDTQRLFAISEMKWMINNCRRFCFPDSQLPNGVISAEMYQSLMDTMSFIRTTLAKLNIISNGANAEENLLNGIKIFQKMHGLPVGACDMFTLRHLVNCITPSTCDFLVFCKYCNMLPPTQSPLSFRAGIKRITTMYADPSISTLEQAFNDALSIVKTHNEGPSWLVREAENSIDRHMKRLDTAVDKSENVEQRVSVVKKTLKEIEKANSELAEHVDESGRLLDQVLDEHQAMIEKFTHLEQRIHDIHKGNRLMFIINLILVLIVVWRFIFK